MDGWIDRDRDREIEREMDLRLKAEPKDKQSRRGGLKPDVTCVQGLLAYRACASGRHAASVLTCAVTMSPERNFSAATAKGLLVYRRVSSSYADRRSDELNDVPPPPPPPPAASPESPADAPLRNRDPSAEAEAESAAAREEEDAPWWCVCAMPPPGR